MLQIAVLQSKFFFLKTAALNTQYTRCFHAAVMLQQPWPTLSAAAVTQRVLFVERCQPATETARRMYILS